MAKTSQSEQKLNSPVLFKSYVEAGCPKKDQQNFQNFVNMPLVTGPGDSLVLMKLNIPGLHILIGIYWYLILSLMLAFS